MKIVLSFKLIKAFQCNKKHWRMCLQCGKKYYLAWNIWLKQWELYHFNLWNTWQHLKKKSVPSVCVCWVFPMFFNIWQSPPLLFLPWQRCFFFLSLFSMFSAQFCFTGFKEKIKLLTFLSQIWHSVVTSYSFFLSHVFILSSVYIPLYLLTPPRCLFFFFFFASIVPAVVPFLKIFCYLSPFIISPI